MLHVFQDGRVMAPKDAKYPQDWRTVSLDERLTFRFVEERDFHPEELEIARAMATKASLAIQLTRLAEAARRAVVREERNRLAGEIHDGLAQSFTAICMQLGVSKEELSSKEDDALCSIQRAIEVAKFGLAEAPRCAHGHGIPPSQLLSQNGFGLINMQSRPKKVGASLDIRSDVGASTAIVVRHLSIHNASD